jgi:hypothetical protein
VSNVPARTLAAAGTAGVGVAAAAAAYLIVRGLPGVLYAAGICLAALVGSVAIVAGPSGETSFVPARIHEAPEPDAAPHGRGWGRKRRLIAQLQAELAGTTAELEEHRAALGNLAAQLSRESEAAQQNTEQLKGQIRDLESEREELLELVDEERERFKRTLDELGGGIGQHDNELAQLERDLEALMAR